MKPINKAQATLLETTIKESLKNYEAKNEANSLGDLSLYYDNEQNILFFYDGLKNLLNEVQLPADEKLSYRTLRFVLQELNRVGFFDRDCIANPFTVRSTNKDFTPCEELFSLGDDSVKPIGSIWKEIEKDLDDFLKKLLP
ncbi:MAG: hypothetical protein LBF08_03355 [Dysgonamonadaceae bacterium]|jgi:hypothetical protein|nr:hypothetical protein [Dysgonamonadaceae bacterium]